MPHSHYHIYGARLKSLVKHGAIMANAWNVWDFDKNCGRRGKHGEALDGLKSRSTRLYFYSRWSQQIATCRKRAEQSVVTYRFDRDQSDTTWLTKCANIERHQSLIYTRPPIGFHNRFLLRQKLMVVCERNRPFRSECGNSMILKCIWRGVPTTNKFPL